MAGKNKRYKLYLADYCIHTTAFPVEPAAVIWLQGCLKRCPGCMAPQWQKTGQGHEVDPCKLAKEVLSVPGLKLVVISGGEPLLQLIALSVFLEELRQSSKLVYLLYTGYSEEELYQDTEKMSLVRFFDIVVYGPYLKELNEGKGFRGSSNQVVQINNPKYDYLRQTLEHGVRKAEIEVSFNQVRIVGIPPKSLDYNSLF